MLEFKVNAQNGTVRLNLPTSISEITPEYLKDVTANVKVADNYSLIGILYRESLSSVILASNRKQENITTPIIPVFIKAGASDVDFIKSIACGEKLIIAPSDIALGHHVGCPANILNVNTILAYCREDKDSYQNALQVSQPCFYLEFKLIPNCNIRGTYGEDMKEFTSPFINFDSEAQAEG